jgi:hypothetical protein
MSCLAKPSGDPTFAERLRQEKREPLSCRFFYSEGTSE